MLRNIKKIYDFINTCKIGKYYFLWISKYNFLWVMMSTSFLILFKKKREMVYKCENIGQNRNLQRHVLHTCSFNHSWTTKNIGSRTPGTPIFSKNRTIIMIKQQWISTTTSLSTLLMRLFIVHDYHTFAFCHSVISSSIFFSFFYHAWKILNCFNMLKNGLVYGA